MRDRSACLKYTIVQSREKLKLDQSVREGEERKRQTETERDWERTREETKSFPIILQTFLPARISRTNLNEKVPG